jgi:hypothetical protein
LAHLPNFRIAMDAVSFSYKCTLVLFLLLSSCLFEHPVLAQEADEGAIGREQHLPENIDAAPSGGLGEFET